MGVFEVGRLAGASASTRPDLMAEPTRRALERMALLERVGVVEIDPALSDTATTQREFDLEPDALANCVVVAGKREGEERFAACVVLATSRADVNRLVKRHLDVRKASFLTVERVVGLTGMEYGGITPIGRPGSWPVLVDAAVIDRPMVVLGSGIRRSKLLSPVPCSPRSRDPRSSRASGSRSVPERADAARGDGPRPRPPPGPRSAGP